LVKARVIANQNRLILFVRRLTLLSLLLCVAVVPGAAQSGRLSPNPGEEDGVSAGGNWLEFHSEDKMTGEKRVRFLLVANNYFREDQDFKPRVQLFCNGGKLSLGDFNPGTRLAPPDRPGFWGQPQMQVRVRIDDFHTQHGWNWINGHFLAMDKGTVRGLIGANIFNVELRTRSGWQIAEFSPAGLRLDRVRQACGLTPKKPSSD
jgi:hypothetical protein